MFKTVPYIYSQGVVFQICDGVCVRERKSTSKYIASGYTGQLVLWDVDCRQNTHCQNTKEQKNVLVVYIYNTALKYDTHNVM